MMESALGAITAAAAPCTILANTSSSLDGANPHTNDDSAKSAKPPMNVRRRPSRSAARPPSSKSPPNRTAYPLITQCDVPGAIARSPSIDGICHDHDRRIEDDDEESRAQQAQRVPAARVRRAWALGCSNVRLRLGHRSLLAHGIGVNFAYNKATNATAAYRQDATVTPVTARVDPPYPCWFRQVHARRRHLHHHDRAASRRVATRSSRTRGDGRLLRRRNPRAAA